MFLQCMQQLQALSILSPNFGFQKSFLSLGTEFYTAVYSLSTFSQFRASSASCSAGHILTSPSSSLHGFHQGPGLSASGILYIKGQEARRQKEPPKEKGPPKACAASMTAQVHRKSRTQFISPAGPCSIVKISMPRSGDVQKFGDRVQTVQSLKRLTRLTIMLTVIGALLRPFAVSHARVCAGCALRPTSFLPNLPKLKCAK